MKRSDAIAMISNASSDKFIVAATGMISRELHASGDRLNNFYMLGSMGLNSSIGLGVAINCPQQTVIILDGDGSLLMNLGTLALIGEYAPQNIIHIVLDNGVYASTGGQPTISGNLDFEGLATSAGYRYVSSCSVPEDLLDELNCLDKHPRPIFLRIIVEPENQPGIGRVAIEPPEIKTRFMKALAIKKGNNG